ncbi:hypothetical protein [Halalkalicoccus salilacus]|uniref:hypothetical protein n=1 Tax=Halalkalicoccus salilacus TaxID=3117459 RepID=UPI00300E93D2
MSTQCYGDLPALYALPLKIDYQQMPPTSTEIRAEIQEQAQAHYRGLEFTYDDFEAILSAVSELNEIRTTDNSYFVLGSYADDAESRLETVRDQLDSRPGGRAVLMKDVADEWEHSYPKFRLIADFATYLVGIAEHRCGGFLVEMGYFTAIDDYFNKTYVCKLTYPNNGIRETDRKYPFSWMQVGIFDLLSEEQRLLVWDSEDALEICISRIP